MDIGGGVIIINPPCLLPSGTLVIDRQPRVRDARRERMLNDGRDVSVHGGFKADRRLNLHLLKAV